VWSRFSIVLWLTFLFSFADNFEVIDWVKAPSLAPFWVRGRSGMANSSSGLPIDPTPQVHWPFRCRRSFIRSRETTPFLSWREFIVVLRARGVSLVS
jgi:hypothetical protein